MSELLPNRTPPAFSDDDWEVLLAFLQEGRVIPVVGADLSLVTDPETGAEVTHVSWLARQLARKLGLPAPEGVTLDQVVGAHLHGGGSTKSLYPLIRNLVINQPFPVPQPLLDLASITDFKLFITTTFDGLLTKAVQEARPGHQPEELAYAPKQFDDLPAPLELLNRPVIYHLFGKVAAIARYAINEEDTLEWMAALQSVAYTPERLAGELENHHVLLLGLDYHDWLARFFVRTAKRRRLSEDRDWHEYVADTTIETDPALSAFLRTHSKSTILVGGQGKTAQFVATLRRRWEESRGLSSGGGSGAGRASSGPPRFLPPEIEMPAGAVFISYSRTDLEAVKLLKSGLDEAGVVTWFDLDRLEGGDSYADKIHNNIKGCTYFIPVISTKMLERSEAFFWIEWKWALQRMMRMAPGAIFVLPVIIDDTNPGHLRIPEEFKERDVFMLPGGRVTPDFVARLVRLTRGGGA